LAAAISLDYSPSTRILAIGYRDGLVILVDVAARRVCRRLGQVQPAAAPSRAAAALAAARAGAGAGGASTQSLGPVCGIKVVGKDRLLCASAPPGVGGAPTLKLDVLFARQLREVAGF
jgi:hypothetical protein